MYPWATLSLSHLCSQTSCSSHTAWSSDFFSHTYCQRAGGWWGWAWCPPSLWSTPTSSDLHSDLDSSRWRQETALHRSPPGDNSAGQRSVHIYLTYITKTSKKCLINFVSNLLHYLRNYFCRSVIYLQKSEFFFKNTVWLVFVLTHINL